MPGTDRKSKLTQVTVTCPDTPHSRALSEIELFANTALDPTGSGEGETYLGMVAVTTDASGNGSFTYSHTGNLAGKFISSTATDPDGNTSEFSLGIAVPGATASFVRSDTATRGSWQAAYGADGFRLAVDPSANNPTQPAYGTITPVGQANWTWTTSTADPRALTRAAAGSTDRLAACWYSSTSFDVNVNVNDSATHRLSIYAVDFDSYGPRSQKVEILDAASGALLDSRTLNGFQDGVYLTWDITRSVKIRVTNLNPSSNALLSGVFLGGTPVAPATASFVRSDTATRGSWKASYGAEGFRLAEDPSANNPTQPAYGTITPVGQANWTWTTSTADPRALTRAAAGSTDRLAACWYSSTSFDVNVNVNDSATHRLSIYAVDFDSYGPRSQKVEILDAASGALLDSRTLNGFQDGVYLTWDITRSVKIRVTNLNPSSNALLSGVFLDAVQ
jgi:hypothetical protein